MLLSPEDRISAGKMAVLLGVSSDELIDEFERLTPDQEAALEQAINKLNEVLPGMHASLDRIEQGISRCRSSVREMQGHLAAMNLRVSGIEEAIGIAATTND